MKFWGWINQNSGGLIFAAALAPLLLLAWSMGSHFFRPGLLVTVEVTESTVPPDLMNWIQEWIKAVHKPEIIRAIERTRSEKEGGSPSTGTALGELAASPNARRLEGMREINKVSLKITNRTTENLKSVRIKFGHPRGGGNADFWIDLDGDYLTAKESAAFLREIDWNQWGGVVLPPLPDIPANATLEITYYGPLSGHVYLHQPEVEVSATGLKADVQWLVPVPEGWYTTLLHVAPRLWSNLFYPTVLVILMLAGRLAVAWFRSVKASAA